MDEMELKVMRKQTAAFIADNPVDIVLNRNVRTPNGKGGFTVVPTPQQSQTFRKVSQTSGGTETRNVDGEEIKPKFVLIGPYDANVTNNDTFTLDGIDYNVDYVRDDRRYETWVEATYVG